MAVSPIDTNKALASITGSGAGKSNSSVSSLDKDAFLQLLVTQMKYQDPLNPTDNTEYMSQMAQFSQLEAMNNLSTTMTNSQAASLVGSYVLMNTTDASGQATQISGLVDYVTMKNGKALLSIGDRYYEFSDLDSVVDKNYILNILKPGGGETEKPDDTEGTEGDGETDGTGGTGGTDDTTDGETDATKNSRKA